MALEAAFGWEWLADLLEGEGIELHLAHPRHTKAIAAARVKTDAVDARMLAHLLRADRLPEAYVAPRALRELRDLLRHHIGLTRLRRHIHRRRRPEARRGRSAGAMLLGDWAVTGSETVDGATDGRDDSREPIRERARFAGSS